MRPIDLSAFIQELADRSGEAILPFFRTSLSVVDKARGRAFDPVTEADRGAEAVIRRHIAEAFPSHGVLGEEFEAHKLDAEYVWVIDPIDGTRSFLCGLPLWGTLIGLMRNGHPVLGLMNQPYTRERFMGDGRHATFKNSRGERDLAVRRCDNLADAYLMTTDPRLLAGGARERFGALEAEVRLSRYGADCYAYAMLACGNIDLVIEPDLQTHDIMPLVPIIEGAGGIVTTWAGESATRGGSIVAAGDARLHEAVLRKLNS